MSMATCTLKLKRLHRGFKASKSKLMKKLMKARRENFGLNFLLLAGVAWRLFVFPPTPRIAWSLPR